MCYSADLVETRCWTADAAATGFAPSSAPSVRLAACPRSLQQLRQRQRDHFRRLVQIRERQTLIGAVSVGFLDGAGAGAIEHDRNARFGVVARVGVERHA